MNEDNSVPTSWLTLPQVAEQLQVSLSEVRSMLAEDRLLALRSSADNAPMVPAGFLRTVTAEEPAQVPASLRGTLIQLADAGLSPQEIVDWLFRTHAELGAAPIDTLHSGRIHAVRRAAQSLAF